MGAKLDAFIKEVNKQLKSDLITTGNKNYDYERIPFSSPKLNYMTYGGIPIGCMVEFFGLESSGKTTSALDIVANAQKLFKEKGVDRKVFFVDVENSYNAGWAETLGVDTDNLILYAPKNESAETILETVLGALDTGEIGLGVIDSLATLLSEDEFTQGLDKQQYGGISKVLSKFSKKAALSTARNNCSLICINQCRDNLGSMYGGLTTPGGHTFKYMCQLRVMFTHGKFIDADGKELSNNAENPFGNIINVKLEKTKCCAPDRRLGHYTLRYDTGVDVISDLVDIAILYNLINQAGAWFTILDSETGELMTFNGKDLKFQGKPKLIAALKEDPELLAMLTEKVNKIITN